MLTYTGHQTVFYICSTCVFPNVDAITFILGLKKNKKSGDNVDFYYSDNPPTILQVTILHTRKVFCAFVIPYLYGYRTLNFLKIIETYSTLY